MKKLYILLFIIAVLSSCGANIDQEDVPGLYWTWLERNYKESAIEQLIYEEPYGVGNSIRFNQSMCICNNKVFCFNLGNECKVLSLDSKEWLSTSVLPEDSHNNNSQFLKRRYDIRDKYPLLLLSRGDYPPSQNDVYIVRVQETDDNFSFSIVKTIHNRIREAQYGGSWVIDEDHQKLFLYTMTNGDWRLRDNNKFCVFSFTLPDISNEEDVVLSYKDVLDKWEFQYLALQGGTYYNNRLYFNVESINFYAQYRLLSSKNVLGINVESGKVEVVMPLFENKETEGICVYNNRLYISFKDAEQSQDPTSIIFYLKEYSLPKSFI